MINSAGSVEVLDEAISQGIVGALNFAGAGVTAAIAGDVATITIPGGGGGGASGQATLDFGAFPGKVETFTDVTGQTGLTIASEINAWILPVSTADHSVDEHLAERVRVVARWLADGTLRIHGYEDASPAWLVPLSRIASTVDVPIVRSTGTKQAQPQRLHGLFTVGWRWS